jgi:DNA-binding CsgD family transcriptional regulator/tetratricopeptide (TPR) repeat protein
MPEPAPGRLVGRGPELRRLTGLLDDAAAGRPGHALIGGDAGVGKTRLVTELAARAAGRGFTVLSGRCAELGDTIPYLPLADALRGATAGGSPPQRLLGALASRPLLSRLLPDRGTGPASADLPGVAQQQLFGAVLGLLAELAAASPVLLVLEDLHWADRSTRDLLTFLSRVLHRERVAVAGTYRTDDLGRRHPLRPLLAELLRLPSVTAIQLGPLGNAELAEHLTAVAGRALDPAALRRIITRAEGNPYYAEELLAAGDVPEAALPTEVAALLLARVEQVPPVAQQVLRAAAVAGRRVEDSIVRAASGVPAPEYEEAIREAVTRQLLVPGGQGYAFRHALLREAVYGDLLPGERTRLHARYAELLSDPGRLATVTGTAAELAYHCLASHDIAGAFTASVQAAREADELGAPAEAQRHYDQALSLWERAGEPEKLAGMDRGKLAFRSATTAAASGDIARAVHKLRRLREVLADGGDPALLCRVCERLAYYLLETDTFRGAVEAARAAVDALPADPPRWEHARALATHAQTLLFVARDEPAAATEAQRALEAARAAGAPWVEADALVTLGHLSERTGEIGTAIDRYAQAYQQAQQASGVGVELRAAFQLARIRLEQGHLDSAAATAHQGVARAEESGLGLAPYGLDLQYLHYLAHYADGDWDHAAALADSFPVQVTTVAEARLSAMALFLDVARDRPTVAERRGWLEPFWPADRFTAYVARSALAEHALWRGDIGGALAEVAAALAAQEQPDGRGPQVIRVAAIGLAARADRAAAARAAGDEATAGAETAAAAELIEIARDGAANRRQPHAVLGIDGRGWLARAEAEWQRAKGENDPAAWQAVACTFGHAFVYETARTQWRLCEALAEAGHRDEAQRVWQEATALAAKLGARPLQRALDDLARRARLAGGAASHQAPGPLASLTAREHEVLRLLAEGRSNREIAAALFIAPKTASVHVSNILGKLGAATRTEAAAIAHGQLPARR